jgi:hypothetical protein
MQKRLQFTLFAVYCTHLKQNVQHTKNSLQNAFKYALIYTLKQHTHYTKMLTLQHAQHALNVHASANSNSVTLTAQAIANVLNAKASTFANIVYVTQVATSAKHKAVNIQKVTQANVQLFSTSYAYASAVQKSASKIAQNNVANVQQFTAQANYFTHTNCYSIVQHNSNSNLYLYAVYNNAQSMYFINNTVATKQQVAQYLTASAAQKLLQDSNTVVHNATHDVLHTVHIRTIALANIVSIVANKQQISV